MRAFLDEAQALVPDHLKPARLAAERAGDVRPVARRRRARPRRSARRCAFIPNADLDYDSWVRIGLALKGALGDDGWRSLRRLVGAVRQGRARVHREDLGRPQGRAHRRRHDLPPRPGAAAGSPDPALVLNGGMPGRRPASGGRAARAGCRSRGADARRARHRRSRRSTRAVPARRRARSSWSTTWSGDRASGRSRSRRSAPASARSAR